MMYHIKIPNRANTAISLISKETGKAEIILEIYKTIIGSPDPKKEEILDLNQEIHTTPEIGLGILLGIDSLEIEAEITLKIKIEGLIGVETPL